jgi:hypothetical protein
MTDAELIALAALVNEETQILDNENKDRLRNGYSPLLYRGEYNLLLEKELRDRKVIP